MLDLKAGNRRDSAQFGDGRGTRDTPSGEVGEACIENLAGPGEIIEAADNLFERRHAVRNMRPVKIDPISLEPLETRLDRRDHGSPAIAGDEDAGLGVCLKAEFGGQHKIVSPSGQEVFQEFPRTVRTDSHSPYR
jgi:hypothetical protein